MPGYYLAAALIQNDELSHTYASFALIWMATGLVAGAVFGAGGFLARTPGRLQRVAQALPGAVLFGEAAIELRRVGDPSCGVADPLVFAAILVALGLVVSRRALLFTVPLAAAGFVLFTVTGFR